MSLLLHIDTAVNTASVCLSDDDRVIAVAQNMHTRESAAWLQPAIRKLLQDASVAIQELQAVSVSAGPGSYTGLRVGMSSAKGICYALNIPLITVGTLHAMAGAALPQVNDNTALLCPMIDARRMEVFTALYNSSLAEVMAPVNLVVQKDSLVEWLSSTNVYFFGDGSEKVKGVLDSGAAKFVHVEINAENLVPFAFAQFRQKQFAPLAYAEPLYVKAFFTAQS